MEWHRYKNTVPKPRPGILRITKRIHNILHGIAPPDQRVSLEEKATVLGWLVENAQRYWLVEGGALCPPDEGGADIVVVRISVHDLVTYWDAAA